MIKLQNVYTLERSARLSFNEFSIISIDDNEINMLLILLDLDLKFYSANLEIIRIYN
jgi:hypothetical protein